MINSKKSDQNISVLTDGQARNYLRTRAETDEI